MIDFDFLNIDEEKISVIKNKNINRIYQNEEMRIFIEENKISRQFVYDHLSNFLKVIDDKNKCKFCLGLKECKTKGYTLDLNIDINNNSSSITYNQCKLIRKRKNIKKKFIICDTNEEYFDYDLKDTLNYFKDDRKNLIAKMATIIKENSNKSLYFYGQSGIGKSLLLTVFAKLIVSKRKGHYAYVDFKSLIPTMIEESFRDKEQYESDLALLETVDYLFIDNFGEEEKNDFSKENIVLSVLNKRKENGLPTYIASSYSLDDLFKAYRTPKSGNYKTKDIVDIIKTTSEITEIPTSSKVAISIF